jgi:hypothetical protein
VWEAVASAAGSPSVMLPPVIRAFGASRPIAAWAVVDLPEPDSPTRAVTAPGATASETPDTASTVRRRVR